MDDLTAASFYTIEFESDTSKCLSLFYKIFNEVINKHVPVVTKRVKRDKQPEWYTKDVINARKMRDKYKNHGMWPEYKIWRNKGHPIN